jgi:Icc-related predicted phosphoesterase
MRILAASDNPTHTIPFRNARPGGGGSEVVDLPLLEVVVDGLPDGLDVLLAVADLQGREMLPGRRLLGEVVAEVGTELADAGKLPPPERIGVLLAGDFYAEPMADKRGVSGDVWPVWHAFAAQFHWVAGVPGNHDVLEDSADKRRGNLHLLDDDQVGLDGLNIAGLGGIIGNPNKPHRRADEEYCAAVQRLVAGQPHVLVLHESPDVREERLRGNRAVREALGEGADTLVVCGHCHWPRPLATLPGGTQVLNVDGRCVVLRRPR